MTVEEPIALADAVSLEDELVEARKHNSQLSQEIHRLRARASRWRDRALEAEGRLSEIKLCARALCAWIFRKYRLPQSGNGVTVYAKLTELTYALRSAVANGMKFPDGDDE